MVPDHRMVGHIQRGSCIAATAPEPTLVEDWLHWVYLMPPDVALGDGEDVTRSFAAMSPFSSLRGPWDFVLENSIQTTLGLSSQLEFFP